MKLAFVECLKKFVVYFVEIWYNKLVGLFRQGGGESVEHIINLVLSVVGSVVGNLITKWFDRKD